MQAPEWDAKFATHKAHGVQAQAAMLKAVLPYVKQRRVAVDVGAHIGLWSAQLAPLFNAVFAFEPVDENYSCLIENVRAPNVSKSRVALGREHGAVEMALPANGNSGCWFARTRDRAGTRMVPMDYLGLVDVDLIKIDVEGNEAQVLYGAQHTIALSSPVIMFEDNGTGPRYFGVDWIDPKLVLRTYGYRHAARVHKDEIWVKEKA
jgi:FkbM family methyltransferase